MSESVEALARRLLLGATQLKEGKPAAAAQSLAAVAKDPDLKSAPDLSDVRARACSLYAQALLQTQAYPEATTWVREALRITRSLEDEQGLKLLHGLQAEILQERDRAVKDADEKEKTTALSRIPIATIREEARSPFELAQKLVLRSQASVETGRLDEAFSIAHEALLLSDELGMTKERVLARLILARTHPDEAPKHIEEALTLARDADETQLITLIGKTATLLAIEIKPHELPTQESRPNNR